MGRHPIAQLSTIKEETGYTHLVVDHSSDDIVRKMSEYERGTKVSTNELKQSYTIAAAGPLGSHHATGNRRRNRRIIISERRWRSSMDASTLTLMAYDTRDSPRSINLIFEQNEADTAAAFDNINKQAGMTDQAAIDTEFAATRGHSGSG